MACELRLRVVVELAIHADYYLEEKNLAKGFHEATTPDELVKAYAMYSDKYNPSVHFDPRSIFIQETLHCAKQFTFAGIWHNPCIVKCSWNANLFSIHVLKAWSI